jgi:hypothetical protein
MNLSGIISIGGMPGLFKVVAQSKNGVIVESMLDKKRFPAYSTSKISALEDISMFTTGDDKPLSEIMQSIYDKEKGGKAIDNKADDKAIVAYFAEILPDYDKERVYISNMRKLFAWYNIMQETGNLKLDDEKTESSAEEKKVKTAEEKTKVAKTTVKDTSKVKTKSPTMKVAGVRKSGTA